MSSGPENISGLFFLKRTDLFSVEFQLKNSAKIRIIHKAQKKSEISAQEGPEIPH
jgi:hypothetical protein